MHPAPACAAGNGGGLILSNTVRSGVIGLAKSLSNELAPFNVTGAAIQIDGGWYKGVM
jgi:NAD(P)-dependent dehydrogenase (short-subunit alcohol dehydrogenase family)